MRVARGSGCLLGGVGIDSETLLITNFMRLLLGLAFGFVLSVVQMSEELKQEIKSTLQ